MWSEVKSLSHVQLFVTPWTVAYKAPLSMEFSRQEYWSGLPFPSPGDLLDPGIELGSPALQADTLPSEPPGKLCANHHTPSLEPVDTRPLDRHSPWAFPGLLPYLGSPGCQVIWVGLTWDHLADSAWLQSAILQCVFMVMCKTQERRQKQTGFWGMGSVQ